jgi:NTE family protein
MTRALVLAGGGLTGIGWEIGILTGLADEGVVIASTTDLIVGTSAGSAVGGRMADGTNLGALYDEQLVPPEESSEKPASLDMDVLGPIFEEMLSNRGDSEERCARVGALALAAATISEAERRRVVASRFPSDQWPQRRLMVMAVDAFTGKLVAFERSSGVPLVDAVAASCAVPGIWPPISINGTRYIDGGVRDPANADLASGFDTVLLLAPMSLPMTGVSELKANGRVQVVVADDASLAAMGPNPLDPAFRAAAARAGRIQGMALAESVGPFWIS